MATATATRKKRIVIPSPEEQGRLATVPSKADFFDGYFNRTIPGGESDFEAFEKARVMGHNVLIEGPTGSGKTSAVYAYAAWKGMPLYSVSSSVNTEPSQLFGKFIPDETGKGLAVWQDGPVTDIVRHGGVLLINEVNFIPERISTVLFGLLDKRKKIELQDHKGEVICAPTDGSFLLVADMNPDYEGTRPLNKAFRNRFAAKLFFDYDPVVEAQLIVSKALLKLAGQMRDSVRQGTYDTPIATNMLIEFEEYVIVSGMERAVDNFANSFPYEDRKSVQTVFETHRANLERDYASFQANGKVEDTDDAEWGIDNIEWQ
jgi:nitric oxide reductase NorQ protein